MIILYLRDSTKGQIDLPPKADKCRELHFSHKKKATSRLVSTMLNGHLDELDVT